MLQKFINFALDEFKQKEIDSEEYKIQSNKCHALFEELCLTLSEEQKKKLLKLDLEYFMCAGQWKDDGYKEGLELGFRLGIKLITDCMRVE